MALDKTFSSNIHSLYNYISANDLTNYYNSRGNNTLNF